jgi:hypothetical protein
VDVRLLPKFFGLPLAMVDRGHPHFDFGGGSLAILPGQPYRLQDPNQARFPVVAFAVENLHDVIFQLKSHGVEMPRGSEEDSDSRWVMFYEPGGNLIEVVMMGIKKHH